jgi:hypothetical protein
MPYAMALLIGLIANKLITILSVFTNNKTMSNVIGFLIGLGFLIIWKLVYYKLVIKSKEDRLNQFR